MVSPNGLLDVHSGFSKGKPSFIFILKGVENLHIGFFLEKTFLTLFVDGTRSLQFDVFPSTNFGYDQCPTGMNRRNVTKLPEKRQGAPSD